MSAPDAPTRRESRSEAIRAAARDYLAALVAETTPDPEPLRRALNLPSTGTLRCWMLQPFNDALWMLAHEPARGWRLFSWVADTAGPRIVANYDLFALADTDFTHNRRHRRYYPDLPTMLATLITGGTRAQLHDLDLAPALVLVLTTLAETDPDRADTEETLLALADPEFAAAVQACRSGDEKLVLDAIKNPRRTPSPYYKPRDREA